MSGVGIAGGEYEYDSYFADIWSSADSGVSWTHEAGPLPPDGNPAPAPAVIYPGPFLGCGGGFGRASFGFTTIGSGENERLIAFGGVTWSVSENRVVACNDVWLSENGRNWTQVTSSIPWRARYGMSVARHKTRSLIVMTGGVYDELERLSSEVWSTEDGITWIKHGGTDSLDGSIEYPSVSDVNGIPARSYHGSVFVGDSVIVFGGVGSLYHVSRWERNDPLQSSADGFYRQHYYTDMWQSTDFGVSWTRIITASDMNPRTGFGMWVDIGSDTGTGTGAAVAISGGHQAVYQVIYGGSTDPAGRIGFSDRWTIELADAERYQLLPKGESKAASADVYYNIYPVQTWPNCSNPAASLGVGVTRAQYPITQQCRTTGYLNGESGWLFKRRSWFGVASIPSDPDSDDSPHSIIATGGITGIGDDDEEPDIILHFSNDVWVLSPDGPDFDDDSNADGDTGEKRSGLITAIVLGVGALGAVGYLLYQKYRPALPGDPPAAVMINGQIQRPVSASRPQAAARPQRNLPYVPQPRAAAAAPPPAPAPTPIPANARVISTSAVSVRESNASLDRTVIVPNVARPDSEREQIRLARLNRFSAVTRPIAQSPPGGDTPIELSSIAVASPDAPEGMIACVLS